MAERTTEEHSERSTITVGLLSDPDYPSQLATSLATELSARLAEQIDDDLRWDVHLDRDPITAVTRDVNEILRNAGELAERNGWDVVIYLTDLPIREGWAPVVAELSVRHQAGVISLPALGGRRMRKRACDIAVRMVGEIDARYTDPGGQGRYRTRIGRRLASLTRPMHEAEPHQPDVQHRFVAPTVRGRIHLLLGMLRSNRPWRLVLGMTSAVAAAIAMSAFMGQSEVVWEISNTMGTGRLIVTGLASIVIMAVWIIVVHNLWESSRKSAVTRDDAVLYNSATLVTVTTGVLTMYVGVFAFNLVAAQFLITPEVLESTLQQQQVGWQEYVQLGWLIASAGMVAGALGSGLEDEATVRQAAYGYRERQRYRQRQHGSETV